MIYHRFIVGKYELLSVAVLFLVFLVLVQHVLCLSVLCPWKRIRVSPLPLPPLSAPHSNGHLQKHTGTHRAHTGRQTDPCPSPGHRPAPPASLPLTKPDQSIPGSIATDVRRGGSEPARGLRRDQRHRISE